ncbi:hypothetical protein QTP81_14570 [Alteromonas sp. ASW11-36]|uniref:Transporter substrate-binding domain-containing protein n=1 Tax=Alteromonas arenosi TaxID=3055817 RepID=A0ABT7T213_9ALTE|nr:hypothetical protein [Alteromonas sp. ASW11-36]MDM7861824.1 hypothetical protein [Alteromonas sp. ASW11-36]
MATLLSRQIFSLNALFFVFMSAVASAQHPDIDYQFQRTQGTIYYTVLSKTSPTQVYFIHLLEFALEQSRDEFGGFELSDYPVPMDQARQIKTLQSGDADVMWTMTTPEREAALLPVKFALLQGMLGKRVFLVSAENQDAFKNDSLEILKQRLAIQGLDWPDTTILQANGFRVSAVPWYEWQFGIAKLLLSDTVEYFPRSIVEARAELALPYNQGLAVENHHMLDYPAFIYFFVNPAKPELQQRILHGLQRGQASGELQVLFESYPGYKDAVKLLSEERTIHRLNNPLTQVTAPSQ